MFLQKTTRPASPSKATRAMMNIQQSMWTRTAPAIARLATTLLKDKGKIYCEINEALANETRDLFKEEGFKNIRIIKDINNKDRIISADK